MTVEGERERRRESIGDGVRARILILLRDLLDFPMMEKGKNKAETEERSVARRAKKDRDCLLYTSDAADE